MGTLRKGPSGPNYEIRRVSDLKFQQGLIETETVSVLGYAEPGDGGEGIFRWETSKAPYTDDGGVTIIPTNGNTDGAWIRQFTGYLNVRWWGAGTNNNQNDDSIAFNAAWTLLKTTFIPGATAVRHVSQCLLIPPGSYVLRSTVYWNDLKAFNVRIIGEGASILVEHTGVGFDFISTRGLFVTGLHVYGSSTITPTCLVLVGPKLDDGGGNNSFQKVVLGGNSTIATFWNIGTEIFTAIQVLIRNGDSSSSNYGLLCDGYNEFGATSNLTLRAPSTAVSFTINEWLGSDITNFGGGAALFISRVHEFLCDEACYIASFNKCAVIDCRTSAIRRLSLSGNWETTLAPGVDILVEFLCASGTTGLINGFKFGCATPTSKVACFKTSDPLGGTPGTVIIHSGHIEMTASPPAGVYFDCANLIYTGLISVTDSALADLSTFTEFNGTLLVPQASLVPPMPNGQWEIVSRDVREVNTISIQGAVLLSGLGSPEGVITANPGSVYFNLSGGASVSLYVKESGTGNIGWIGK